jgi:hypothetical protein
VMAEALPDLSYMTVCLFTLDFPCSCSCSCSYASSSCSCSYASSSSCSSCSSSSSSSSSVIYILKVQHECTIPRRTSNTAGRVVGPFALMMTSCCGSKQVLDMFLLICFSFVGMIAVQNCISHLLSNEAEVRCVRGFLATYAALVLGTFVGGFYYFRLQMGKFHDHQRAIEQVVAVERKNMIARMETLNGSGSSLCLPTVDEGLVAADVYHGLPPSLPSPAPVNVQRENETPSLERTPVGSSSRTTAHQYATPARAQVYANNTSV